jgi:hypothetical protein
MGRHQAHDHRDQELIELDHGRELGTRRDGRGVTKQGPCSRPLKRLKQSKR